MTQLSVLQRVRVRVGEEKMYRSPGAFLEVLPTLPLISYQPEFSHMSHISL